MLNLKPFSCFQEEREFDNTDPNREQLPKEGSELSNSLSS
jgi:hypothetical protein